MTEIWKSISEIPGYENFTNYELSDTGILRRTTDSRTTKKGHVMKWDSYGGVTIFIDGVKKKITREPSVAFLFRDDTDVFGKLSDVAGFNDEKYATYQVMKNGDIRPTVGQLSYRTYKWLANELGYISIRIRQNGSITQIFKHRIQSGMYVPNPDGKQFVDHIDGDCTNNSIDNLRWCTRTENNRNIGIRNNNTSGVPNICKTNSGKNPVWHIQFTRRENGTDSMPISEYFPRDNTSDIIPPEIVKRRNELAIEFHGSFARQY